MTDGKQLHFSVLSTPFLFPSAKILCLKALAGPQLQVSGVGETDLMVSKRELDSMSAD